MASAGPPQHKLCESPLPFFLLASAVLRTFDFLAHVRQSIAHLEESNEMTLREYLERGVQKTALAKQFNVCRRTIYNWIYAGWLDRDLDAYAAGRSSGAAKPQKLDPFKLTIAARLKDFPALTAQRLFQDVQAEGYGGSYSGVKNYVRQVRPQVKLTDPLVRFETEAGQQAQVDFGSFRLPWGRRYALVIVLGFSRLMWLRFYTNQTSTLPPLN